MSRITTFVGDFPAVATVPPPAPNPIPPAPGDTAPTYPSYVPAPGSIVQDTTVPDEGTATDTLTFAPSYTMPQTYTFHGATQIRPEQGNRTVYATTRTARSGYRLTRNGLSTTERDTLKAFCDAHPDEPFFWTPPGGAQATYRLASNGYEETKTGGAVWSVRIDLVRLR